MKKSIKEMLFAKHILVSDHGNKQVEAIYAMRNKLNIAIKDGFHLASIEVMESAADMLGRYIPEAFYRGFPNSVRELTPDVLLLDQLTHYTKTYGFGEFNEAGHSLFETVLERSEFSEEDAPKEFRILSVEDAVTEARNIAQNLLDGTRPVNEDQFVFIKDVMEGGWKPASVASKTNACKLLIETQNLEFVKFLSVSDFVKVVDELNVQHYFNEKLNNLRLKNQDRKFLTEVLDAMLKDSVSYDMVCECAEKRNTWKGILHHIHYVAKNDSGKAFIDAIFRNEIRSVYSRIERTENAVEAARILATRKGSAALLRNINCMMSRANSMSEVDDIIGCVKAKNPLVMIQLQHNLRNYNEGPRTFKFTKHGRLRTHKEETREYFLDKDTREHAVEVLEDKLIESLKGRVNKVYIAPGMEKIAVPLNMSAGQSGFGIMPTGSRIPLPEGKKIRAFTYWEKVNDIDLSAIGIDEDGTETEFSWRSMWKLKSDAIIHSGDQTSGYYGGSEYFDIDIDLMKELYPRMKYLVFCDNVYSDINFDKVICRAGWMSRDIIDSGEVYEPETVKSAYTINAKTTFAYLFGIDLGTREIVWLNISNNERRTIAGTGSFDWMNEYFTMCNTMNVAKLFTYAANEVVDNPDDADIVIGDIKTEKPQIKSYEFEKVLTYLS